MDNFFDKLQVGDELKTRETKYSPWVIVTVTKKDGDSITLQNDEVGEIQTDKEEIDEQVYYQPL